MSDSPDLDAYLARIGWSGPLAPDRATLAGLIAKHTAAIAFENLDPFLGKAIDLSPGAVEHKLVGDGRGGYCYEHNLLFRRVLAALGFQAGGLAARVLWGRPEGTLSPRSHMLLQVELEGATWLADVGFGGLTVTAPLRLEAGPAQPTPHERFRLSEAGGEWTLEAEVAGGWRPLYRFDLQRQHDLDYAASSWFLSTNPGSPFVTGLMVARAAPDRRLTLRDRSFALHRPGAGSERRTLGSAAELRAVLSGDFGIALPDHADLDRRLDSLPRELPR
ncbi:N-hydroxyarylamine O-acetyltransferase [Tistlia consotensis]|uniref:N-hydroxyarylamine O-acetyltransferase n=1 Tax=Tistlia consotensis USBA 355 TaxID=560819 RepID=A0A1Y6BLE0_9PROT|nr:arylamine N-acetyltransferase [Tistlia consotensis]SMF09584.1 N-hydroxyarylamine O-acetyltransferase [Tistlia consotensis USBA 355]SNR34398.1 N-hydroxyarylamine O-acetyltransferase [Tistlia consotensis]